MNNEYYKYLTKGFIVIKNGALKMHLFLFVCVYYDGTTMFIIINLNNINNVNVNNDIYIINNVNTNQGNNELLMGYNGNIGNIGNINNNIGLNANNVINTDNINRNIARCSNYE